MICLQTRTKSVVWVFTLPICAAITAINVVSQGAAAGPVKYNYMIEQKAQAGPHRIHFTEQGVKIESLKMGFALQYRASDNLVTLWSLKNHTYYTMPYEKWIASFRNLFAAVGWYSELVKPTKTETKRKDNLTFHIYHYLINPQSPSYWSSDIGHKEPTRALEDVYYSTVDLPSKQASAILEKCYGTPLLGGFPYWIEKRSQPGGSLSTSKMNSAYVKPIDFFVPTSEYKKISFTNQIIGPSFDENMTKMMLPY